MRFFAPRFVVWAICLGQMVLCLMYGWAEFPTNLMNHIAVAVCAGGMIFWMEVALGFAKRYHELKEKMEKPCIGDLFARAMWEELKK